MMAPPKKDFAAMEGRGRSGDSAARAALRSRMAHPTSLRLDEIQPNPQNPRYEDEEDPTVRELADTLSRVGQLQPALVVAVDQYVQAYPDFRGRLGHQPWVVIVGNRRLAAARLAGRASLDVRVAGDIETADDFEDRILIENLQRKDLPPLLEAEQLQRRLNRPGQNLRSVGAAIGKSHAYVQQRVDLLGMIPELQELFRQGAINIRAGRKLGALPEAEQRRRLAAGSPFVREDANRNSDGEASAGSDPGNPVSNAVVDDERGVGAGELVNAVSNGEQRGPGEGNPTARDNPVNPVATAAEPRDQSEADPARSSTTIEGDDEPPESHPQATQLHAGLEAVQLSVGQWLDSALAELDRVLPRDDGTAPNLTQALAETQRHILAARESLRETRI
jgi:ParB/RepB/Spo0J family partition protein